MMRDARLVSKRINMFNKRDIIWMLRLYATSLSRKGLHQESIKVLELSRKLQWGTMDNIIATLEDNLVGEKIPPISMAAQY